MRLIGLQLVFVLSWSSGFIGAGIGAQATGAINLLFWRFLLVTLCLAIVLNTQLRHITLAQLRYHTVIGFLSQFLYLICVYVAIQNGLPAGIAAIVAALQPIITAVLSSLSGREKSVASEWWGLVIGLLGVTVVVTGQYMMTPKDLGLFMYLLPLISALGLSLATLYQRNRLIRYPAVRNESAVLALFIQSGCSLCFFALCGVVTQGISIPGNPEFWVSVIWLTVFSTFVAYIVLWRLLGSMSATRVAVLVYLEPPVTLIWGALMFGDPIYASTYLGVLGVAAGVFLVARMKPAPAVVKE